MGERERIWSWYGIGIVMGVHESTVKRWSREYPEFRRIIRIYGRRVFAYMDDLNSYRKTVERSIYERKSDTK